MPGMEAFRPGDVLVVTDLQNDFLPGGLLAVPGAGEIVEPLARIVRAAEASRVPIIATRDWHPPDHCSFQAQGGPWPPHCIRGTPGAELSSDLRLPRSAMIVSKATRTDREAYSAFEGTDLADLLGVLGVRRVVIGGLTTDYCVRETVRDARELGFEVLVLFDAVRAIDVNEGDGEHAMIEMIASGARTAHTTELLSSAAARDTRSGAMPTA